ncbi:MAG: hypothetical protein ACLFWG_00400 [Longimicrobiales bacterium]
MNKDDSPVLKQSDLVREGDVRKTGVQIDEETCANPWTAIVQRGQAVLWFHDGGKGFEICFKDPDRVPFKNWQGACRSRKGTLQGTVDPGTDPGLYWYAVKIDGEEICDPIIWVQ